MFEYLLNEHPEQTRIDWPQGFEGGIAHRLDVSSGQLLVATDLKFIDCVWTLRVNLLKRYLFLTRKVPWTEHTICAHHQRKKQQNGGATWKEYTPSGKMVSGRNSHSDS